MKWSDNKIFRYLERNTRFINSLLAPGRRPSFLELVKIHLSRGGWIDHLMTFWLVPPTFGLSAWLWNRYFGSCVFAGFIDPEARRVGCLIHPALRGAPDLRRHAFPLIPTLGCNRALRCPMLASPNHEFDADFIVTSQRNWRSIKDGKGA
jgi:hypothetical protein